MKQLILSAFVLFLSTISFAQNFEIGMNGGWFSKKSSSIAYYDMRDYKDHVQSISSTLSPVLSVTAKYNYKKWQGGVTVAQHCLTYKDTYYTGVGCFGSLQHSSTIKETVIPIRMFLSRKFVFHKLETYCSASGGYVTGSDKKVINTENTPTISVKHKYGFTAGIAVGGTYFITHNIGINIETGIDYMPVTIGSTPTDSRAVPNETRYKLFSFPATLGIRYKL